MSEERERKLSNRKKRASKGRIIRVSTVVYNAVETRRQGRSWDSTFRWILGLPDREGKIQRLAEGMLDVHSGTLILKLDGTWDECEEITLQIAEKWARKLGVVRQRPIRMREVR
jgi:hypothetical protein